MNNTWGNAMKNDKKIEINQRVINNIYDACKLKNKKISEIETGIGVHIGYFSKKRKYQAPLNFTEVYEAAEILGISVDELVRENLRLDVLKQEMETLEEKRISLVKTELQELESRKKELLEILE